MSHPARNQPATTAARILDVAERLVQTRGFNGFSYADIASELGITKASLHYHFATKAELGRTLITRYTEAFEGALQRIAAEQPDARERLRAYVKLYTDVITEGRMCLCGMVAAEYGTLPADMQSAIRLFFEFNEGWLARVLEHGSRQGHLALRVAPRDMARMLVGALEGEMLVARTYGDAARFESAAKLLLSQLEAATANETAPRAGVRKRPRRSSGGSPIRARAKPAAIRRAQPR
jgi:TetR/AcrR family transcriptional regulator, transcriptional repressor for nem operon